MRELSEFIRPILNDWLDRKLGEMNSLKDKATCHEEFLQQTEPVLIAAVLERCRGNQAATCRILGMDSNTLNAKSLTHGHNRKVSGFTSRAA